MSRRKDDVKQQCFMVEVWPLPPRAVAQGGGGGGGGLEASAVLI